MILDSLEHSHRYAHLHPGFAAAFDFLKRADLPELPLGKHTIDGERLFALVAEDAPKGDDAMLESHRRYIDVQYVISGADLMGWRPIERLTVSSPYDSARDIAFYSDCTETWFNVTAGRFAIFFPEDAHAPLGGTTSPRKAVVKVAVDW
jgi:YhcH/YjgK/YiaL family protein